MGSGRDDGAVAQLRALTRDRDTRRGWIIDANDGVIATAGILEGLAGAGGTDATLVVAASAAMIAGALAVGGARWAETGAARDEQVRLIAEEREQLVANPDDEVAELAEYWAAKGLTPEVARQVAEQLSARDALAAQLESEHGIDVVISRWASV